MRPLDPRLLQHARAARGYVALTAALGALTAGLVVAQALLLARVVAPVVVGGATLADVRSPVLALLVVVTARAGVAWAQERYGHRAATSVIGELRARVVHHAADLGPAALAGERGPALATLTTRGLDALDGYLVKYLPQLLMAATVTPAVLAVVWWHDTIAGITVLLTLPLVPLFMALVGLMTRDAADRRLRSMQRLGAQVLDLVAGLPTLRALGRERGQGVRVREVGEAYRRATMRTLGTAFLSALVLESLTTLSVALVAVGIGLRLVYGHLDLQTGLAVLVMAPEAYLPLRMVGVHYHASVDGIAAAAEAFAVLEEPAPAAGSRPAPALAATPVRLRGVTVVHPGRDRATPAALDLDVAPGEVVALAGPSGVGKTTAAAVLLGLRRPDAGQVLLGTGADAVDLADVDPATWWPQVAWVPQRPIVVPGTLAENVLLGTDDPDGAPTPGAPLPAALLDAAREAGLADVVAALPAGWQTRVGHGGAGLSAGQRQRLGLARAFLRDAALVVLDEPTAHLDPATEQAVHAAIGRLRARGRSVVLVAHRPALLALADRVVTVVDGPAPAGDGGDGGAAGPAAASPAVTSQGVPGTPGPAGRDGATLAVAR